VLELARERQRENNYSGSRQSKDGQTNREERQTDRQTEERDKLTDGGNWRRRRKDLKHIKYTETEERGGHTETYRGERGREKSCVCACFFVCVCLCVCVCVTERV
jgi:hypothetical protein